MKMEVFQRPWLSNGPVKVIKTKHDFFNNHTQAQLHFSWNLGKNDHFALGVVLGFWKFWIDTRSQDKTHFPMRRILLLK